ncbi:hypothetical protein T484DRAFT_3632780, partial [Baffinella frigidus]
ALRPAPYALHPAPCTLRPTPYALHPTPYAVRRTPYTLHSTPYALHPTPYTLHPAPCTLHPTPYALHPHPTPVAGPGGPTYGVAQNTGILEDPRNSEQIGITQKGPLPVVGASPPWCVRSLTHERSHSRTKCTHERSALTNEGGAWKCLNPKPAVQQQQQTPNPKPY